MNHPRTPPIFTMLPQVIQGIREDEFMIGFEQAMEKMKQSVSW